MLPGQDIRKRFLVFSVMMLLGVSCPAYLPFPLSIAAGSGPQQPTTDVEPRGKPRLLIQARIDNGPWITTTSIYPLKGQKISLRVRKIPNSKVRWFRIRPDTSPMYKNANHPWEKNPYKWIGLAKIKYHRQELVGLRGRLQIQPFDPPDSVHWRVTNRAPAGLITRVPGEVRPDMQPVGRFWFQVEVEHSGTFVRSYGIEDNDKRGLNPKVFRVSRRDGKGYLGFLTSFFNVPGLFGSIPYQSHNYIGVDCADVLVAAYCKWKNTRIKKDQCVAGLIKGLPKVLESDLHDGNPARRIRWGTDVRAGYLVAVRYFGAKSYQHIGALAKDSNSNGLLDGEDLVLHAGPSPLHYTRLKTGKFDGHIMVLEPDFTRLAGH
jgi:hypothetical protein